MSTEKILGISLIHSIRDLSMDFLKKIRKKKGLTANKLGEKSNLKSANILAIEIDKEVLGEERASRLAKALKIPEDVITVYRKRLPQYAHKVARENPDKLEKGLKKIVKKLEKEQEDE